METTKVYTVQVGNRYIGVSEPRAREFKEDAVKVWEMGHRPYLAQTAIDLGKKLNAAQLLNKDGIGDPTALETARGKFLLEMLLEKWDRTTDTSEPLPITPENIGTLPRDVCRFFGVLIEGDGTTQEELDALKKA